VEHFVDTDMYVHWCTECRGNGSLLLDLCRQFWLDEFVPELERGACPVPVLEMLLGGKSFLSMLRLPLRLRSGLAAKAGMHSTSAAFRRTAQTPYKLPQFRQRRFDCAQGSDSRCSSSAKSDAR